MGGDVDKTELLRGLGYGGSFGGASGYDAVLQAAGLSRAGKGRISEEKRGRVVEVMNAAYFRVCSRGDCDAAARVRSGGRTLTQAATQADCEVCGGSSAKAAVDAMIEACAARKTTRLCVVGGFPNPRQELMGLVGDRLMLRMIDGTTPRTRAAAEADMTWADLVVLWGATPLDHSVSLLYRGEKVIQIAKRGVSEVAKAVVVSMRGE